MCHCWWRRDAAAAADTGFPSAVVDYRLAQTSFNRGSMPPVTPLVRCVREGREGRYLRQQPRNAPEIPEGSTYLIVERAL
jgi:hypothetical protein